MTLATVMVLVALLAASWIASRFLPPAWQQMVPTPLGYLAPISYLVTAACMALGGVIAGRRFLVVALGLTFALWIATGAIAWHRRYEGLVRASLRRATGEAETWTPIRELGELQISYALPRMLALVPAEARTGAEERVRLAFQILFGTLNNMILINPGPYTIHHPETGRMLAQSMTLFILHPAREEPVFSSPSSVAATARSSRR